MALRQIVETVIAAREIIRRRIGILSGSYAELPGSPRELKSADFGSVMTCHEAGFSTVKGQLFAEGVGVAVSAQKSRVRTRKSRKVCPLWRTRSPAPGNIKLRIVIR